ncbi:hypothetical protein FX988_02913 [Paraglaciecola mesophila]|uniref:Uncharacterized protein n=1 Tax=Paraglaciecola mesophila TaxID=197222 RepID=A0A857JKS4_9ALTE|nr:hypothetical protein [Paraglaciecola mesophila]QHJ12655.1 hypothetical protein FX988_02913 [Paraglaciecola mesophila]
MLMQITMIVLIVSVGVIVGLTGMSGGGFLTTFLAAFGLFVIIVLGAAMVLVKKRNANKDS